MRIGARSTVIRHGIAFCQLAHIMDHEIPHQSRGMRGEAASGKENKREKAADKRHAA
ncbi:hypothetical protein CENSYa_1026 [Cenarchaeum symbiosum A]|uniref:Uncharacterized protein n=1 Tax=Cenarchaeum symbiosum (strain A) TaxID=414004 RepID=A0RWE1_CENSY|nr:hypothetical protein CENSYa_1026 [Cenarchaeum symbiosum A]